MAIPAGSLTERLTLQARVFKRNSIGEQVVSYKDLITCRGSVKFTKTMRQIIAGHLWEPTTILVNIRYSEALLKTRRVIFQGNPYDVDGVPLGDHINQTITMTCVLHDEGMETEEITDEE